MNWIRLLEPVLGPFSGPIERRVAIKRANQSFGHITQFIKEFNETLFQGLPAGLVSSGAYPSLALCHLCNAHLKSSAGRISFTDLALFPYCILGRQLIR